MAVHPFLQIAGFQLPAYGVLLTIACVGGVWLSATLAPQYRLAREQVYRAATAAVLGALVFAKLGDLLIGRSVGLHYAGTFLSGFVAALVITAVWARSHRVGLRDLADCFAPSLALGVAIVRIGCFFAGCDYGTPSSLPWAVTFRDPLAASLNGTPLGVPLHPAQLYESALGVAILGLLWLVRRWWKHPGAQAVTFFAAYACGRFVIEFVRGDADRGIWEGLSTSQWLCLFVLLLAIASLLARPRVSPAVALD